MTTPDDLQHGYLPTRVIFGWLLTTIAWEMEVGLFLLHWFCKRPLNPFAHGALLAIAISLTAYSHVKGKHEFWRLQRIGSPILLTKSQSVLLFSFIFGFCAILGFIVEVLVDK